MTSLTRRIIVHATSLLLTGRSPAGRAEAVLSVWRGAVRRLGFLDRYHVIRQVYSDRRMHIYPLTSSHDQARTYAMFRLVEQMATAGVPGDVVECGVGFGMSILALRYAMALFKLDKIIYGFDSFAGFPPASDQDVGARVQQAGRVPAGWTETAPALIERLFADDADDGLLTAHTVPLRLVPGFFADTLPFHLPDQIALLHVDCDLYESTRDVLVHALPRMAPGGVVIFDEYDDPRWPGARIAADEAAVQAGRTIQFFAFARRWGMQF